MSTLQLKGKNRKEQKPAWVLFSFCPNPCFDFLFLDVNVNAVFIFMIVIACQVNLNKNYFGRKCYFVKCYTFKHLSSSMYTVKSKSRLLPIDFFVVVTDHECFVILYIKLEGPLQGWSPTINKQKRSYRNSGNSYFSKFTFRINLHDAGPHHIETSPLIYGAN